MKENKRISEWKGKGFGTTTMMSCESTRNLI